MTKKKQFSEKALQAVLAEARAAGKRPRDAAIKLFEGMETDLEAVQRTLSAPVSPPAPKRRSPPKAPVAAEAKPKAKVPAKKKSGYGAQRGS